MAANIPPPSNRSMQRTANMVCGAITDLNNADTELQREHLRDVNEGRGLPRDAPIRAECDGRYNKALRSGGGRTPFQPGTQATYTIIENQTEKKKIISVHTVNKLCSQRGRHHGQCTVSNCKANVPMDISIGDEERWAGEAYNKMQSKDRTKSMMISHFTTDGDSKAGKGIQQKQRDLDITLLRDTQHLGVAMYKKVCNTPFSSSMFLNATKAQIERAKREHGHDIRRRVSGEFNAAFEKYQGDTNELVRHFSHCTDAIVKCYGGSCGELCAKYSLVCSGLQSGNWNHQYYLKFLSASATASHLQLSKSDEMLLRSVIAMRLSPTAINLQKFNTNTQKSESTNRSFSRTNPKCVTFTRNFEGRIHSAVLTRNQGIRTATMMKCAALNTPVEQGSKVHKALQVEQKRDEQRAAYHRSLKAKTSRRSARLQKYQIYSAKNEQESYRKEMLINQVFSITKEHTYATRLNRRTSAEDRCEIS